MRTTMLRTALVVTGGAVLITAACADGGKNPVAPESHVSAASSRTYAVSGASNTTAGTPNKGVIDPLAEVSVVADCAIPLGTVVPGAVVTNGHFVVAGSGNFHLICHGELPDLTEPPTSAMVFPAPCNTPANPVDPVEGHVVITPSGRIHLVCHGKTGTAT
jgi:hypothetical protein